MYGSGWSGATIARASTSGTARKPARTAGSWRKLSQTGGCRPVAGQLARRCSSGTLRRPSGGVPVGGATSRVGLLAAYAGQPGRRAARAPAASSAGADAAYGLLAVDLAAALAARPSRPSHRHERDDDGRHQPEQDLHRREARRGTPVRRVSVRHRGGGARTGRPSPSGVVGQRRPDPRRGRRARALAVASETDASGLERVDDRLRRPGSRPRPWQGRGGPRLHRAPVGAATGCARSASRSPRSTTCTACARCTGSAPSRSATSRSSWPRTSAHRGTSFDASRLLIDTLKAGGADLEAPAVQRRRRGVGGVSLISP